MIVGCKSLLVDDNSYSPKFINYINKSEKKGNLSDEERKGNYDVSDENENKRPNRNLNFNCNHHSLMLKQSQLSKRNKSSIRTYEDNINQIHICSNRKMHETVLSKEEQSDFDEGLAEKEKTVIDDNNEDTTQENMKDRYNR